MPKQVKKSANSLSKVNKSRHKNGKRLGEKKRKKQVSEVVGTSEEANQEASVKIEDAVESSSRLTSESKAAAATVAANNGSSAGLKMNSGFEGLAPQSNGMTEHHFFLDREIGALFNSLCYSEDVLSSLPNRTWAIHSTEVPEKRVVVSAAMMHNSNGTGLEPLYMKQIIFDEKLNFNLFLINSRMVLKDKPTTIATMHDFEDLVDYVESLKLCSGGPSISQYSNVNPECAYKDPLNKWRHNLCSLEISVGEEVCDLCQSLDEILRRRAQRTKSPGKLRNSTISAKRKQRSKD